MKEIYVTILNNELNEQYDYYNELNFVYELSFIEHKEISKSLQKDKILIKYKLELANEQKIKVESFFDEKIIENINKLSNDRQQYKCFYSLYKN